MILTIARRRVLLAAARLIRKTGTSPSLEDLRLACGLASRSGVERHIARLVVAGLVVHRPRRARTLRLTDAGEKAARIGGGR